MKSVRLTPLAAAIAGIATLTAAATTHAQGTYPNRPVRVVVPFVPGGSTDIIGRTVAQKLSEAWGQSVVVDNRGGNVSIPVDAVLKSPPDGHTMLLHGSSIWLLPFLQEKIGRAHV